MVYIVPLYLMILAGLTYVVTELHNRDVQIVVKCLKSFRHRFLRLKRNWQMKDSLIETFSYKEKYRFFAGVYFKLFIGL